MNWTPKCQGDIWADSTWGKLKFTDPDNYIADKSCQLIVFVFWFIWKKRETVLEKWVGLADLGRLHSKGMNFRKNSKRPWTPPWIHGKERLFSKESDCQSWKVICINHPLSVLAKRNRIKARMMITRVHNSYLLIVYFKHQHCQPCGKNPRFMCDSFWKRCFTVAGGGAFKCVRQQRPEGFRGPTPTHGLRPWFWGLDFVLQIRLRICPILPNCSLDNSDSLPQRAS